MMNQCINYDKPLGNALFELRAERVAQSGAYSISEARQLVVTSAAELLEAGNSPYPPSISEREQLREQKGRS